MWTLVLQSSSMMTEYSSFMLKYVIVVMLSPVSIRDRNIMKTNDAGH